ASTRQKRARSAIHRLVGFAGGPVRHRGLQDQWRAIVLSQCQRAGGVMRARCWALATLASLVAAPHAMAETVLLHVAGSLRGALTEAIAAYSAEFGDTVQPKFGASGLLKAPMLFTVTAPRQSAASLLGQL